MKYNQITKEIKGFERFVNDLGKWANNQGRWATETSWPIEFTCDCGECFQLEKHDVNGKTGIWLGSESEFFILVLECPHCIKNDLYQIWFHKGNSQ